MNGKVEPRTRFFNEQGSMIPPFVDPKWRGCVLDRDNFDNARLPEHLFHAIVSAAGSSKLSVARYAPCSSGIDTIAANWPSYRSYFLAPSNWSLEYVVFDASERWALLADADATVFGAAPVLATRIDQELSIQGTSLVQLTDTEFPKLQSSPRGGAAYVLAVSGR
jgi:hypothetical protein